jgi:hypothetical protein
MDRTAGVFFLLSRQWVAEGVDNFLAHEKVFSQPLAGGSRPPAGERRPRGARRWVVAGRTRGNGHGVNPYTLAADGREARFHQRAAPAAAVFHHTKPGALWQL